MAGDKLRRVRSVQKWLEKAEHSYSAHKEISGEWNLIMAQAEMQRLKETDKRGARRKSRIGTALAMAAAVCIFSTASFVYDAVRFRGEAPPPPEVTISPVETAGEAWAEAPADPLPEAGTSPQEPPAPERAAPPAAERPVLSPQEIQSVVGEAGRTLRGQS